MSSCKHALASECSQAIRCHPTGTKSFGAYPESHIHRTAVSSCSGVCRFEVYWLENISGLAWHSATDSQPSLILLVRRLAYPGSENLEFDESDLQFSAPIQEEPLCISTSIIHRPTSNLCQLSLIFHPIIARPPAPTKWASGWIHLQTHNSALRHAVSAT